jgi:integrase
MPRRSSGPRLWFDKKRGTWTIIDGRSRRRTGFALDEVRRAEKFLGAYIASKHVVQESATPYIADVLSAYATEHLVHKVSGGHIIYDIRKLAKWWGEKRVAEITAKTCRAYAASRKAPPCARRELAFLGAAIKHWNREHGPLLVVPNVTLPPKPSARSNFMTRGEAARFLLIARRTPHLARFFIVGWYTGSRRSVIAGLKWSMISFETATMLRKERGAIETKKKAPPVRMSARLMAHLRRWKRMDDSKEYLIRYQEKRVKNPIRVWNETREAAGLPEHITPHILRHSRATTMLKAGVAPWEVANALGMSLQVLISTYGHHHPDWQKDAAEAR